MLSSPAFVNEILDRNSSRYAVAPAQLANVRDGLGWSLSLRPGQRLALTPRLDAFDDHFAHGTEVAILEFFLHEPFGLRFEVNRHGRTLAYPDRGVNS